MKTQFLPFYVRAALYVVTVLAVVVLVALGHLPAEALMLAVPQLVAILNLSSGAAEVPEVTENAAG